MIVGIVAVVVVVVLLLFFVVVVLSSPHRRCRPPHLLLTLRITRALQPRQRLHILPINMADPPHRRRPRQTVREGLEVDGALSYSDGELALEEDGVADSLTVVD